VRPAGENDLKALRALVLVDGFRTAELFESLGRLLQLRDAELLLVYVRGPAPRAGLELMQHRPGGHKLPSHREHRLTEAELEGSTEALAEAERLAGQMAANVESRQARGEPGRTVCELAAAERVDVVALRASGPGRPPAGPASLGPTARFITDHSPCPVLLLRGNR
jgi:nucleotide-binding universal stress UspA family protein